MSACPACDFDVMIPEDPIEGELLDCEECGTELEVVALEPIVLVEAPEEEEDWGE